MEQPAYGPFLGLINFLWLFILLFFILVPLWRRYVLAKARESIIRQLENKRGSRLITLIHRQESLGFFGIPIFRYINIEDSEQVLRAIRMTPPDMPIDLIVHTPGGLALAATQIANALVRHKGPVRVIVPHYAMSGGSLLALASDEIVMDPNAVLGPVDPQIGQMPAVSILKVLEKKELKDVEDQTLILADVAQKAIEQMKSYLLWLLTQNQMEEEKARYIAEELATGKYTHDYPLTVEYLKSLGLKVNTEVPEEVYLLMELFPQPMGSQLPSVQYIPVPYKTNQGGKG
ncbi:MAG: ATP-dependent Clp protease proteolytic subunit [Aquificaceae bacterium]|nr:ATP-dependent Clp protease proteolytic subunit [Aquificaceae bacterium]MCS7196699.1 ATP-dependent Clp protease proteolytic subunit [Aquificaceae bacterium]MDW8032605.1 ATP-dependent Clp protease proteolytic subunit [Aquificaceae bacterium]MDW8294009.1 ATP-dependent Clp protease proteolytic subunit [Aquificaceae bacterium]